MSKRNITYVKPNEPKFLRKLKEEIGYKEGPTVDTKRQAPEAEDSKEFGVDLDEEQPQVVVLSPGDLTAEQAAKIEEDLRKEAEEGPADLSEPIVFKAPRDQTNSNQETRKRNKVDRISGRASSLAVPSKKEKKDVKSNKSLLSFDDEDLDGQD